MSQNMSNNKADLPPDWNRMSYCKTLPEGVRNLEPSQEFARIAILKGRGLLRNHKEALASERMKLANYRANNPCSVSSSYIHTQLFTIQLLCEAITQIVAEIEYLKEYT